MSEDNNNMFQDVLPESTPCHRGKQSKNCFVKLSSDGVLMITAPKLAIENKRSVPIVMEEK